MLALARKKEKKNETIQKSIKSEWLLLVFFSLLVLSDFSEFIKDAYLGRLLWQILYESDVLQSCFDLQMRKLVVLSMQRQWINKYASIILWSRTLLNNSSFCSNSQAGLKCWAADHSDWKSERTGGFACEKNHKTLSVQKHNTWSTAWGFTIRLSPLCL